MTDVRVVDASAVAALLFEEPEADAIAVRLDGAQLVAPSLLGFELANVCVMKCRRHPLQRAEILAGFDLRHRLGVETIAVDHADVVALAERFRLTVYAASYLCLARRLGAEIVTLDAALQRAADSISA